MKKISHVHIVPRFFVAIKTERSLSMLILMVVLDGRFSLPIKTAIENTILAARHRHP
jgi:hypothetical protein